MYILVLGMIWRAFFLTRMSYTFIVEETTNLRHAIPIHTREGHERLYVYEASDTAIEKIDSTRRHVLKRNVS